MVSILIISFLKLYFIYLLTFQVLQIVVSEDKCCQLEFDGTSLYWRDRY